MKRAKVIYFSGEIPQGDPEGDQRDLFRKLRLLSKERNNPVLASFIDSVTSALKAECAQQSRAQRDLIPYFESVLDLTDHVIQLRKTSVGGAIERVLALVFQLGSFVAYHEAYPLEYNFQASNCSLIARGIGLLSAVAIGLSPSVSMIPIIAEDLTRVAFRLGIVIDQVCRSLEISPSEINAEGTWVYCVYGVDEDSAHQAVVQFNTEKAYPETNMASVFNVDGKSVSIGGPPSTLKALFSECDFFTRVRSVPMKKIQGMWHTDRLYGTEHVRQIVPNSSQNYQLHISLFSPVTGQPFEPSNDTSLLEDIIQEMLMQRVYWDRAVDGVTRRLTNLEPNDSVQLIVIQPSPYVEGLLQHWRAKIPTATLSSHDMMSAVMGLPIGHTPPRDAKSSKIAVVGMACRFPGGADDIEKFWDLLAQGREVHDYIPPDRFNVKTHVDPTGAKPNTSKTPYGCFVDNPGLFDPMFFGMSPREAEQTDPMHRLALVTAYEALESSGYVPGRSISPRRVGTFYGQASDDYREVNSGQEIDAYFIPGGCRAFAPGRINYFFKFWGPSFSVDTACSSGLAAIQTACTSLWSADIDMAIAGGLNIITNSDVYAGLSNGHFLSSTGSCKTWDEEADGYCRADGVGSVILKRLDDAEADNDNILGVILSAATDHSAEAVSITHPHDVAQALLYTQITRRAGIDPLAVSYVEMHGTGTQAGDVTEMKSVTSVYAPLRADGHSRRPPDLPLHIGSVKANMGHGEAAAGIMAFIKTLLVLQKSIIPPHVGIKTRLNPSLPEDLAHRNVVIPLMAVPWAASNEGRRLAMVNNFGAAGGNTSIIVEDAAPRLRTGKDTRQVQVLTISAKTGLSLHENVKRLVRYLKTRQDVSMADLSYTLSARRGHYSYRVSIVVASQVEAVSLLQSHIETSLVQVSYSASQPPVAFSFTGQGTFYTGIGAQLYRDSPLFRRQLDQLDSLAQRQNFPTFLSVVTGSSHFQCVSIVSMHLAIVCVEIALARLWASFGVQPSVVIGHSLGEYAALTVAGVLSDSAAVFLVGTRATLLNSMCTGHTHGLLSVRSSVADIVQVANGIPFEVACINGPNETVVGGSLVDMEALSGSLTEAGFATAGLDVAHAYHTSQMNPLLAEFSRQAQAVVCRKPSIPVISPLRGRVLTGSDQIDVSYLVAATRGTVNFTEALRGAWSSGVVSNFTIWLEIGHHPACRGFIRRTLPSTPLICSSLHRDFDNWTTLARALCALYSAGVNVDWTEYHRPFEQALRLVDAPTYAWNNKNYWIQYRGDWNLTKGRSGPEHATTITPVVKEFQTSSIHRVISEQYNGTIVQLSAESSITDPSIQGVVDGHAMNGNGVVSSFLQADMAYTLARRIYDQSFPRLAPIGINITDFEYHEPVVKQRNTSDSQPIRIVAEADLDKMEVRIKWFNPFKELWYCHATILYEDSSSWLLAWSRSVTLLTGRIKTLNDMAANGKASKLTTELAYSLFGKLVDYSEMYQTMQSVILYQDEAVAEVLLPVDTSGTWTVPPHFIDGLVSLSGFILNGGTRFDNTNNFFITPSWKSMRFAKPLAPGGRYFTYVRMVPADHNTFVGDVYILQDSNIVGVVEAIMFRQWPRVMLNRFFSPPDDAPPKTSVKVSTQRERGPSNPVPIFTPPISAQISTGLASSLPDSVPHSCRQDIQTRGSTPPPQSTDISSGLPQDTRSTDITSRALILVAEELGIDAGMLTDDAQIVDLGLDSIMSLVVSQRLREELGIEIRDGFFMEISTIRDLKKLLY